MPGRITTVILKGQRREADQACWESFCWANKEVAVATPVVARMTRRWAIVASASVVGEIAVASIAGWQLERRLGEGATGVVHLAVRDGQEAALKAVKPALSGADASAARRLGSEIAAGLSIASPHVASILDFDVEASTPYVASQFIDGLNVADHVDRNGPLTGDALISFGAGLAAGIAAIAEAGIIHCDLKPSNVVMSDCGPVIIDLGIAIPDCDVTLTGLGELAGSPGWMAPEQLGGQPVLGATDVFGWGAVMHFAATGSPPFGRGSPAVVMNRINHGYREPCPVQGALGYLIDRALSTQDHWRPTPVELSAAMKRIGAGSAGAADRGSVGVVDRGATSWTPPVGNVFVGRRSELEYLCSGVLADAGPKFWCIDGPVGIGKSRLLSEVGRVVAERGHSVYGLAGAGAGAIGALGQLPAGSLVLIDDLAAFDRRNPADGQPLLHLLHDRGVSVMAAVRTSEVYGSERLVSMLGGLDRLHRLQRLTLGALAETECDALYRSVSAREPMASLSIRTGGNPLLICRLANATDTDGGVDGQGALPLTGLELLRGLSRPASEVLTAAACLDVRFQLADLMTVARDTALFDGFEECLRAGLLLESADGSHGWFPSEIVRDQIIASTSAARRRSILAPLRSERAAIDGQIFCVPTIE